MSSLRYFNIYMYFIYNICNCLCLLFSRMFEAFKYMSYLLFLISKQKPLYCLIKNNIFVIGQRPEILNIFVYIQAEAKNYINPMKLIIAERFYQLSSSGNPPGYSPVRQAVQ